MGWQVHVTLLRRCIFPQTSQRLRRFAQEGKRLRGPAQSAP
jgi:hypothetical protein